MRNLIVWLVTAVGFLGIGCYKEPSGDTNYSVSVPSSAAIFESGGLGQISVVGANVEARARFTFNDDEFPVSINISGEYTPSAGGLAPASVEAFLYDTLADQDASNDVLIGSLSPAGPLAWARLDCNSPGRFSITLGISGAANDNLGPLVK